MGKVGRRKKAPAGWEDIEPTIQELDRKLREGTTYPSPVFIIQSG